MSSRQFYPGQSGIFGAIIAWESAQSYHRVSGVLIFYLVVFELVYFCLTVVINVALLMPSPHLDLLRSSQLLVYTFCTLVSYSLQPETFLTGHC